MKSKHKVLFAGIFILAGVVFFGWLVSSSSVPVLQPKGTIAEGQKDLIVTATLLSLIVVLPVFVLTAFISWKYRAGNTKAKYTPDWDGHRGLESLWWGVPLVLIIILSVIIYKSSHEFDPFKPLEADAKPLNIQVVALQWKWLFIYPEQGIASVNFLQFPEDRPINFDITSAAPMNSFWIPSLGGQVYAMSGMSTKLHLMANEPGDYRGSSANISGEGFAGMNFTARASSEAEFEQWAASIRNMPRVLTMDEYRVLAKPSQNKEPLYFASSEPDLYSSIINGYMKPDEHKEHEEGAH